MTRLFLLTLLVALLAPATASAATYIYDVPDLVEHPLMAVKKATSIDVLLPSQFTSDQPKLYSEGRGRGGTYRFDIGAVRHCRGATACFVASFRAKRGGKPSEPAQGQAERAVTAATSSRCAAAPRARPRASSGSRAGVLYTIEGKFGTQEDRARACSRALANSGDRARGPR